MVCFSFTSQGATTWEDVSSNHVVNSEIVSHQHQTNDVGFPPLPSYLTGLVDPPLNLLAIADGLPPNSTCEIVDQVEEIGDEMVCVVGKIN